MARFLVWQTTTETVTYKHVVEADNETMARALVEFGDITPDQGEWVNTDTTDSEITKVEAL